VLYACDYAWWTLHDGAPEFSGDRWTAVPLSAEGKQDPPYLECAQRYALQWVHSADRPGLSRNPRLIHQGGNSGYQAINLAYHFGASRILLLGYDMAYRGGAVHWHGKHPPALINPDQGTLRGWAENFTALSADLEREGVEVINCTPGSALTCFPMARIEDVL
jgi:hypothetical protein